MIELLLTEREKYDLTLYKQARKQAEILTQWGIPYVIGRDGRLRVLREHLKVVHTGMRARNVEVEPNLDGLARR